MVDAVMGEGIVDMACEGGLPKFKMRGCRTKRFIADDEQSEDRLDDSDGRTRYP